MIDLDKFKGKTLDDDTFAELRTTVDTESARADAADTKTRTLQRETNEARDALKTERDTARTERDAAFSKLGVQTMDELEALPTAEGQAEAAKQYESQIRKLQRENTELTTARDTASGQLTTMRRGAAIAQGIEGIDFRNPADVRVLIDQRVVHEGDDFLFKTDDGKLVPIKEGATWFAKTRPDYVKAADAGGQGSGFKGAQGAQGASGAQGQWSGKGDMGGNRAERVAAIKARFPNLQQSS